MKSLAASLGALAIAAAACDRIPRLRVPQVEEAVEIAEGTAGDRYAAHRACLKSAPDLDGLLLCMRNSGYDFVARTPEYPAAECWQLRDRRGADLPPAYCWEQSIAERAAPPAPEINER